MGGRREGDREGEREREGERDGVYQEGFWSSDYSSGPSVASHSSSLSQSQQAITSTSACSSFNSCMKSECTLVGFIVFPAGKFDSFI